MTPVQSKPSFPVPGWRSSFLTFLPFAYCFLPVLFLWVLCKDLCTTLYLMYSSLVMQKSVQKYRQTQVTMAWLSVWGPCHTSWEDHTAFGQESSLPMGTDLCLCFQIYFLVCKTVSVPRKLHMAVAEIPRV